MKKLLKRKNVIITFFLLSLFAVSSLFFNLRTKSPHNRLSKNPKPFYAGQSRSCQKIGKKITSSCCNSSFRNGGNTSFPVNVKQLSFQCDPPNEEVSITLDCIDKKFEDQEKIVSSGNTIRNLTRLLRGKKYKKNSCRAMLTEYSKKCGRPSGDVCPLNPNKNSLNSIAYPICSDLKKYFYGQSYGTKNLKPHACNPFPEVSDQNVPKISLNNDNGEDKTPAVFSENPDGSDSSETEETVNENLAYEDYLQFASDRFRIEIPGNKLRYHFFGPLLKKYLAIPEGTEGLSCDESTLKCEFNPLVFKSPGDDKSFFLKLIEDNNYPITENIIKAGPYSSGSSNGENDGIKITSYQYKPYPENDDIFEFGVKWTGKALVYPKMKNGSPDVVKFDLKNDASYRWLNSHSPNGANGYPTGSSEENFLDRTRVIFGLDNETLNFLKYVKTKLPSSGDKVLANGQYFLFQKPYECKNVCSQYSSGGGLCEDTFPNSNYCVVDNKKRILPIKIQFGIVGDGIVNGEPVSVNSKKEFTLFESGYGTIEALKTYKLLQKIQNNSGHIFNFSTMTLGQGNNNEPLFNLKNVTGQEGAETTKQITQGNFDFILKILMESHSINESHVSSINENLKMFYDTNSLDALCSHELKFILNNSQQSYKWPQLKSLNQYYKLFPVNSLNLSEDKIEMDVYNTVKKFCSNFSTTRGVTNTPHPYNIPMKKYSNVMGGNFRYKADLGSYRVKILDPLGLPGIIWFKLKLASSYSQEWKKWLHNIFGWFFDIILQLFSAILSFATTLTLWSLHIITGSSLDQVGFDLGEVAMGTDLVLGLGQKIEKPEQVNENSEQEGEDSEQVSSNSEQVSSNSEQKDENPEQVSSNSGQESEISEIKSQLNLAIRRIQLLNIPVIQVNKFTGFDSGTPPECKLKDNWSKVDGPDDFLLFFLKTLVACPIQGFLKLIEFVLVPVKVFFLNIVDWTFDLTGMLSRFLYAEALKEFNLNGKMELSDLSIDGISSSFNKNVSQSLENPLADAPSMIPTVSGIFSNLCTSGLYPGLNCFMSKIITSPALFVQGELVGCVKRLGAKTHYRSLYDLPSELPNFQLNHDFPPVRFCDKSDSPNTESGVDNYINASFNNEPPVIERLKDFNEIDIINLGGFTFGWRNQCAGFIDVEFGGQVKLFPKASNYFPKAEDEHLLQWAPSTRTNFLLNETFTCVDGISCNLNEKNIKRRSQKASCSLFADIWFRTRPAHSNEPYSDPVNLMTLFTDPDLSLSRNSLLNSFSNKFCDLNWEKFGSFKECKSIVKNSISNIKNDANSCIELLSDYDLTKATYPFSLDGDPEENLSQTCEDL